MTPLNARPQEIRRPHRIFSLKPYRAFIHHNKNLWPQRRVSGGGQILVELNSLASSHVAYSYLANTLAHLKQAQILGFKATSPSGPLGPRRLGKITSKVWVWRHPLVAGVYQSFGVSDFLFPDASNAIRIEAREIVNTFRGTKPDKKDLELLKVRGIRIGDLFYDHYLRETLTPTANMNAARVYRHLFHFVCDTLFWIKYFAAHKVQGVIVSHCVYGNAIPLRIATSMGKEAYQATSTALYRLSPEEQFAYKEVKDFPTIFQSLSTNKKKSGLREARLRLERRFGGEVGIDMPYSTASGFTGGTEGRLIVHSENPKVLVAAHSFIDSPHAYGDNLFPDFWEWLQFLGGVAERTQFDWYVKVHPDYDAPSLKILRRFLQEHSSFRLLPRGASHHQLIREGITVALTVHGTLGFEYPYLGVPVINASPNNPHMAYSFGYHPISVTEYEKLLVSIPQLIPPGGDARREIEEFYYMKNIARSQNLFFSDYLSTLSSLGGYWDQFSDQAYGVFVEQWSKRWHSVLSEQVEQFVKGSAYLLTGESVKGLPLRGPGIKGE